MLTFSSELPVFSSLVFVLSIPSTAKLRRGRAGGNETDEGKARAFLLRMFCTRREGEREWSLGFFTQRTECRKG